MDFLFSHNTGQKKKYPNNILFFMVICITVFYSYKNLIFEKPNSYICFVMSLSEIKLEFDF